MSESYSTPCVFCAEECSPSYTVINGEVHQFKHKSRQGQVPILENPTTEVSAIQNNLEVFYILREIFNYPSEKCVPYLSEFGGLMHPEHWFTVCSACRICVQECYRIRRKVTQLEKKLEHIKSNLKHSIFSSTSTKRKSEVKQTQSIINCHQGIWNDLRNHVLQGAAKDYCELKCDNEKGTLIPEEFVQTVYDSEEEEECHVPCTSDISRVLSPMSSNILSNLDCNETHVSNGANAYQNLPKPEVQQKQKLIILIPTTSLSRLKVSNPCDMKKQVEDQLENVSSLSNSPQNIKVKDKVKVASPLPISDCKPRKRIRKYKPKIPQTCDECPDKFPTLTSLAVHKRSVHANDPGKEFKCPECDKMYYTSISLDKHLNLCHSLEGSDLKWAGTGSLGFRKVIDESGLPFYCDHCDIILLTKHRVIHHVEHHHDSREKASCQHCEEKCASQQLLQFHLKICHPHVPEVVNAVHRDTEETPQACPHCSESFATKRRRDYHIAKSHMLICSECGYIGRRYKDLQNHLTTVHAIGEKLLVCELCSKRFTQRAALNGHKQVEHYKELGLTPFKCTVCGTVTANEKALKLHERAVHKKEKNHFCEFCGKGFTFPTDIKRHLLLHTAPREEQYQKGPFFCKICNAKFNVRQGLYYHMKQKHNDTFSFRCGNCGKGYCSLNMLEQHKKSCLQ